MRSVDGPAKARGVASRPAPRAARKWRRSRLVIRIGVSNSFMVILLLLTPACSAGVLVRFEQPVMQPREAAELPDRAVERKQQERRDRRALAQMRPMRQGSSIPSSNCFDQPVMYITRYHVMQGTRRKSTMSKHSRDTEDVVSA